MMPREMPTRGEETRYVVIEASKEAKAVETRLSLARLGEKDGKERLTGDRTVQKGGLIVIGDVDRIKRRIHEAVETRKSINRVKTKGESVRIIVLLELSHNSLRVPDSQPFAACSQSIGVVILVENDGEILNAGRPRDVLARYLWRTGSVSTPSVESKRSKGGR